jgi:hypothetical protein
MDYKDVAGNKRQPATMGRGLQRDSRQQKAVVYNRYAGYKEVADYT